MAAKSRLGRGLGALFPTLPDEQEFQHEAGTREEDYSAQGC